MDAIQNTPFIDMSTSIDMSTPLNATAPIDNSTIDMSTLIDMTAILGMSGSTDMSGILTMSFPNDHATVAMTQPTSAPSFVNEGYQAIMHDYGTDYLNATHDVGYPGFVNNDVVDHNGANGNAVHHNATHSYMAALANMEHEASGSRVRRPRNSFILYRQWMSKKLRTENPSLTAGSISQIVGSLWRNEATHIKTHFNLLAKMEEQRHRTKYPNYRYEARRLPEPQPAYVFDGMHIGERLILAGH